MLFTVTFMFLEEELLTHSLTTLFGRTVGQTMDQRGEKGYCLFNVDMIGLSTWGTGDPLRLSGTAISEV